MNGLRSFLLLLLFWWGCGWFKGLKEMSSECLEKIGGVGEWNVRFVMFVSEELFDGSDLKWNRLFEGGLINNGCW